MKTVVIFGGSGFVGRHIIRRVVKNGHKIIIPHQSQVNEAKLRLLGTTGQIIPLKYRYLQEEKILSVISQADLVINLKTLWNEKKISFKEGILDFNINLVNIIKKCNQIPQLIYFSGIGVDKINDSERTKAIFQSEIFIQQYLTNSIIVRPGIIIGGEDQFLKSLIPLFKMSFFIPLFGDGLSKFQPVYIDDVSIGINNIVKLVLPGHHLYEFVGPEVFTYQEFYKYLSKCINKKRVFVSIPFQLVRIVVLILEKVSLSPLNLEQLQLFKKDNISSNNHKKLNDLQVIPQDLRGIIKKIIKNNT